MPCPYYKDQKDERLEEVDAYRVVDTIVHVLGRRRVGFLERNMHYHIAHDIKTGEIISEDKFFRGNVLFFTSRAAKTGKYWDTVSLFEKLNINDLEQAVKDIRVYQGAPELGKPYERVDTGKPEAFVKGEDTFWLRVRAYELGADAVINYQPGSSVGTPVKFKKPGE